MSHNKTRSGRSCRYDAAHEYLQSALADFLTEPKVRGDGILTESDPEINHGGWRSEPISEVSSHICQPKWRRLLKAVGCLVSDQIACNNNVDTINNNGDTESCSKGPFVSVDSCGGGTCKDVTVFLSVCLEAMELNDKDTGYILIDTYHFLQADDLPLCAQTWRPLLVTSLLAAANSVCKDDKVAVAAATAVQNHVAHWWSFAQAVGAYKAFISREAFQNGQLSPSRRADIYFELRDLSLRMSFDDESNASAVDMYGGLESETSRETITTLSVNKRGIENSSFEISVDSEVTSTIMSL